MIGAFNMPSRVKGSQASDNDLIKTASHSLYFLLHVLQDIYAILMQGKWRESDFLTGP